jgi:hypothetical protein
MAPRPQWRRKGGREQTRPPAIAPRPSPQLRGTRLTRVRSHGKICRRPASDRAPGSDVADRLARLETLDLSAMRQDWRRLYRAEPPRLSRDLMMRALAYRIQEIVLGGLSKATLRRLAALAAEFESDGRIATPAQSRIKPGARLVREWHGRTHAVGVTEEGFEFEGKLYRSLTGIAREITGAGWSGPRFFGLARAASVSGRNHAPLGKSDWDDGGCVDDPSQCVEA